MKLNLNRNIYLIFLMMFINKIEHFGALHLTTNFINSFYKYFAALLLIKQ